MNFDFLETETAAFECGEQVSGVRLHFDLDV